MRPLFAIAPLAAVLVLVGPTPHEANVAMSRLWERLIPANTDLDRDVAQQQAKDSPVLVAKPGMRQPAATPIFTSAQSLNSFQASLKR